MRKLRKNMAVKRFIALAVICILSASIVLPVMASPGEVVISNKTGLTMKYQVIQDVNSSGEDKSGSVQLGDGSSSAIAQDTTGTVFIPNEAMIYDAWETIRVFRVDRIAANAFAGCTGVTKVHIEGNVELSEGAFDGLPDTVVFETNSTETKKALLRYGIPYERVKYVGLKTKYVAFGDSIAAGFALEGFIDDSWAAPQNAFVSLVTEAMNTNVIPGAGPALLDNQAASGWTSRQLLDQLNRGDYDAALKDADVVSITIGSNDLLGPFMEIVAETFKNSAIPQILEKDRITIRDIKSVINAIPGVIDTLNTDLADNTTLNAACETFKTTNMPAILEAVNRLAPNADVYWTTLYNPFYGQVFDLNELFPNLAGLLPAGASTSIDLGTLGAKYIEKMNEAFAANTNGYYRVDLYEPFNQSGLVNVKFERGGDEENPTLVLNFDPHPNAEGHRRIAEDHLIPAIQDTHVFSDPPADLSHEKQFTEFSIAGGQGTILEAGGQISVSVPYGTDVTRQAAVFTASEKATVYVGDTLQESGVTVNDYTQPVTYTVFAEDETSRQYTVTVTEEQKPEDPVKEPETGGTDETTPKEEQKPAVPVKKPETGGTGGATPAVKIKNLAVKTGDDTSVMGLFCLMAAAGAVVLIAGRSVKKHRNIR